MSVVNEFGAKDVRFSPVDKKVYILSERNTHDLFLYDIKCTSKPGSTFWCEKPINFFLSLKTKKCLILFKSNWGNAIHCGIMQFWIEKDMFVPSCLWLVDQQSILLTVKDEFQYEYASYLLDNVIND